MFEKNYSVTALFSSLMILAACSVSTPSAPKPTGGGFFDSKLTVQGPAVEGHWRSVCTQESRNLYRQFDLNFKADTVTRDEILFSDATCAKKTSENLSQGRFRFIDAFSDGSFGIEYAFDLGSGMTTFPQEKIFVHESKLFISDFQTGDGASVLSQEPLYLEGTAPNTPTVPKEPTAAVLAASFSAAKYAFCSVQGFAVLVDFQGTSLSTAGQGSAKIGSKTCNTNEPLKWNTDPTPFTVTVSDGYPRIHFSGGSSSYPDYIRASGSYTGLSSGIETFSSFGGNSGGCYFTTNGGTQDVPFIDPCY